jgi:hypothetical protein
MSLNQQQSGYNPSRERKNAFKEFQAMGLFFKEFLADNPIITASIIAAGIGGALEGFHILWLAFLWIHGRL